MKKAVIINAGPRKGWNTDLLLGEAAKGAESKGAETEIIDLYRQEKFTGCISCFGCKLKQNEGRCVYRDGMTETLDKVRKADALIIGSPNYFGNLTSAFRAFYERLVFPYLTYNAETICCNERPIPVLLITTSNNQEENYAATGYDQMLEGYRETLSTFVGPTKVLIAGNTQQVKDYSRYNWTLFDAADHMRSREEDFPGKLAEAFELGASLI